MKLHPVGTRLGQKLKSDVPKRSIDRAFIAHVQFSAAGAVAASNTGVHAGVILQDVVSSLSVNMTNPVIPRALRIKGSVAGITGNVVIEGTNQAGEAITETIVANGVTVVEGTKAFKTITRVVFPIRNAVGDEIALGWNDKLGLPFKLPHNTVQVAFLDNVKEATAPTVTTSATVLSANTIDLNSALNGTIVDVYLLV